jgi:hypothetical protein
MRYAKEVNDDRTEAVIFVEDGGVVTIHHNGEYLLSEMYQDRVEFYDNEVWDKLSEGKMYVKPWRNKQEVDFEMIEHAIDWLCPFCENFIEVEFFNLVSEFNHNQHKKQADL